MRLVDSNVVFSLFVASTPWHDAARALHAQDGDWCTESHALVEVSNVLARYVRARELSAAQALRVMTEVELQMRPNLLHAGAVEALDTALRFKVSAYDARFLRCATQLGSRLVTEDAKLRRAAPRLTLSLDEALAGKR